MDKRIKSGRMWQIEREIENKQFEIARIEGEIAHFNRRIARIAVEAEDDKWAELRAWLEGLG